MKSQRTTLINPIDVQEVWYHVDAEGQVVGRLSARIAQLVRGKMNTTFAQNINPKIHVVITNADKVVFTGRKWSLKTYYRHSGWRTGIKATTATKMLETKPTEILRKAIYGMLPKGPLGTILNKNVRIYAGAEHPHEAQNPQPLPISTRTAIASSE
ncbi:MAG: 50S ribosomal protein L13 [Sumerlaeia bacterium]